MAASKLLLSLSILLSLISFSSSTRPCKTLFISSYSFSVKPFYRNPNSNNPSSGFLTIVTEIEQTSTPSSSSVFLNRRFFPAILDNNYENAITVSRNDDSDHGLKEINREEVGSLWGGVSNYDMSSLRDRTKDILSVVVALLFGVGCGALTAATMYLIWSLFSPSSPRYDYFDGEITDDEDDVKKIGYVKIPEDDVKKIGYVKIPEDDVKKAGYVKIPEAEQVKGATV